MTRKISFAIPAAEFFKVLRLWHRHATTRGGLDHLSSHLRADIGYDAVACQNERRKWFWQGEDGR